VALPAAKPVRIAQARAHVLVKQGLAGVGLKGVPDAVVATAGIYGTGHAHGRALRQGPGRAGEDLEAQAARLSRAIGAELRLQRAARPGPLAEGPRNAYLSPISLRRG
jgi:hypothetical protein